MLQQGIGELLDDNGDGQEDEGAGQECLLGIDSLCGGRGCGIVVRLCLISVRQFALGGIRGEFQRKDGEREDTDQNRDAGDEISGSPALRGDEV